MTRKKERIGRVWFTLLGTGGQYENINTDSLMMELPNHISLEGEERFDAHEFPVNLGEFLCKYASFRKISDDVYLIGNRGVGIFDDNGFIKKKSELRPRFSGQWQNGDEIEPYGNFVCILKVEEVVSE